MTWTTSKARVDWSVHPLLPLIFVRVCVRVSEEIWAYREFTSWLLLCCCLLRCFSSACRLDSVVTVRSSSTVTMANALLLLGLFCVASASHLLQRGKVPGCDLTGVQELAISVMCDFHFHIMLWRLLHLFSYIFFLIAPEHMFLLFLLLLCWHWAILFFRWAALQIVDGAGMLCCCH